MPEARAGICIGLMSGTSLDAVDAAACRFDAEGRFTALLASTTLSYPDDLRAALLRVQRAPDAAITPRAWAALDEAVADRFAAAVEQLLASSGLRSDEVLAIGSHGQTVFHDPSTLHTSLQLGNPSLIAARSGIATVGDFRRADLALGGHGAPLVPAFHHALFAGPQTRVIANIGGIANITVLPGDDAAQVFGFDTGPGNALLDEWTQRHLNQAFDRDGLWAASGTADAALLQNCLRDPYFGAAPPKSTGRDRFNLDWLAQQGVIQQLAPADVQATLLELTAGSLSTAITQSTAVPATVYVCGGGARNLYLMQRLQSLLAPLHTVTTTRELGLDPSWVEAGAFAWLAWRRLFDLPGSLPAVTGARRAAVLGGVYAP